MLDIKNLRENPQKLIERLNTRGQDYTFLNEVVLNDEKRRKMLQEVEQLKAFRNESSKKIGIMKKQGVDTTSVMEEVSKANEKIALIDVELGKIEKAIDATLAVIPNVPRETVVIGTNEQDNKIVRMNGVIPQFSFVPKAHWEIGVNLDVLDFEGGAKLTGSRFTVYKGLGARLERVLINFMLDLHVEKHKYEEMLPPFMVNASSMYGTGQLPKFEEDLFKVEPFGYYLIPTAEVPVTNYHANEILTCNELPKYYTAYTPCFRAEAGAAGKDTRGIIRQHQFNKVELVKFVKPEDSVEELELLTQNAEEVLKQLELPYRTVMLCTGDLGFSSAQTYDIEVWLPSFGGYREISSCSNFEDFQARRANIRFKRDEKAKPEFVHTLNGSGLAVGRTVAAILENYQNEDGSVNIPMVLRKYFAGQEKIEKK